MEGLEYYQAVPYLLVVESIERDGEWVRRAEHPELPGCVVEAASAAEAIEKLEEERVRVLRRLWAEGAPIPVPRPPLRSVPLPAERCGPRWPEADGLAR